MTKFRCPIPGFVESVNMHQKLVDAFCLSRDKNGISILSQPTAAKMVKRSQTWVAGAIRRLNREETCIEYLSYNKYLVHYDNILRKGVFREVEELLLFYFEQPLLFGTPDKELANSFGVNLATIKMSKTYIRQFNIDLTCEIPPTEVFLQDN